MLEWLQGGGFQPDWGRYAYAAARMYYAQTRKDPQLLLTSAAIGELARRHALNAEWQTRVTQAVAEYGDAGPDGSRALISGVYRAHFPDAVKNTLRSLAHEQTACVDRAVQHLRDAGRTPRTIYGAVAYFQ